MYCPNCGKQLPDGAKFCSNCGKDLTEYDANTTLPKDAGKETAIASKNATDKMEEKAPHDKEPWFRNLELNLKGKWCNLSKRTKKIWIISASVVVALAIVAAIVVPIAQAQNDKKHIADPVTNLVDFYNSRSTDMENYYHYFYFPYFTNSEFDKAWVQLSQFKDTTSTQNDVKEGYKLSDSSWGKDWKISITIKGQKELTHSEEQDLSTRISSTYKDEFDDIKTLLSDPSALSSRVQKLNSKNGTHIREESFRKYLKIVEKAEKRIANPKIQDAYLINARFLQKGSKDSYQFDFSFYSVKVDGIWIGVDTKTYSSSGLIVSYYQDESSTADDDKTDSQDDVYNWDSEDEEDVEKRINDMKNEYPEDAKYYDDDEIDWSKDNIIGKIVDFKRNKKTGGAYVEKEDAVTGKIHREFLPPKTVRDPTYKNGQWNYNLYNLDGIV